MKKTETEILIIGGGPAGSTIALYPSLLGLDITLIEKKIFPRETLCGEFLSGEVAKILKELNLFDSFISLKPNRLNSFRIISDSGIELKSHLSFDAYAMKRSQFDYFLIEEVKNKKVKVIQPASLINTIRNNSGFISDIRDDSGHIFQINSKYVIAAYGKQNILDKNIQREFINHKSDFNGIKFHLPINLFRESFSNEIRIYLDDGLYCGLNQVSDSEVTVCFLENRKELKIPSRDRLISAIKLNKHFKKIFSEDGISYLKYANAFGTGNIYFGKKNVIENGIIMVGDAARVISPVAGDGIGMAMESAKILYEILREYKLIEDSRKEIYLRYKKKFRKTFSRRIKTARIIQEIILNKRYRNIGIKLVYRHPILLLFLLKLTRSSYYST